MFGRTILVLEESTCWFRERIVVSPYRYAADPNANLNPKPKLQP